MKTWNTIFEGWKSKLASFGVKSKKSCKIRRGMTDGMPFSAIASSDRISKDMLKKKAPPILRVQDRRRS
jgi:hypothetical protein